MASTTRTATAMHQTGVPDQGQVQAAVPRSSNRGMALPAVNPMVVGTSTAAAPAVPRAAVPAAIWIIVRATQSLKENSSASRTIVKQRGSANQHFGERRSANQCSTGDKVQAVVKQTVAKRRGSAYLRPRKRRSTDQYPNVEEGAPEIHTTLVPVG